MTSLGSFTDVEDHLGRLHEELDESVRFAAETDMDGYAQRMAERFAGTGEAEAFMQASPPETLWPGLDRYLRTRQPS